VYTGIRYYNRETRVGEPAKGRKHANLIYRDRSEWVGVPVPAIVSQGAVRPCAGENAGGRKAIPATDGALFAQQIGAVR
jgi:hypothetical protein